jgi:SAM-dependent methyltransferase
VRDRIGRAFYRGIERIFDVWYRSDTIDKDLWLEDSEWISTRGAIRRLGVTERDVFIDFGSGKGRVLLIASRFPFRRIIGVELSEQSSAVARRNVERNSKRSRCADVRILTCDATEYEIPDDVTVAYFCDPFEGAAFQTVLDRLIASHDRAMATEKQAQARRDRDVPGHAGFFLAGFERCLVSDLRPDGCQ